MSKWDEGRRMGARLFTPSRVLKATDVKRESSQGLIVIELLRTIQLT